MRLDPDLYARAKALAASTGRSFTKLVEDALRQVLERSDTPPRDRRFEAIVIDGNGVRPGIDLDDSSALWDLMDDRAAD